MSFMSFISPSHVKRLHFYEHWLFDHIVLCVIFQDSSDEDDSESSDEDNGENFPKVWIVQEYFYDILKLYFQHFSTYAAC